MCGIVGLVGRQASPPNVTARMREALTRIGHRGPDHVGHWLANDGRQALGHVRLSIIAPSASANQPMISADGRYALVFNGEIYNFRELYESHCRNIREVHSGSDSSVLLYLLQRFHAATLPMLDGMFAFAFVDTKSSDVLLARDRFGEKPMYFIDDGDSLSFSSELAGLRSLRPDRGWNLDHDAVALYHMEGCISAPRTIYAGVHALTAGTCLEWSPHQKRAPSSYWSLERTGAPLLDRAAAISAARGALEDAVRSRMVSDVPVGIFLSGGIDSSALITTAARQGHSLARALCIDFPEIEYSEADTAESIARSFGIRFDRHVIDRAKFDRDISGFFPAMDQPTIDGFNTWFLARAASETGIKVWMSGVGGDELFGGYPSFIRLARLERLSRTLQAVVPDAASNVYLRPMPTRLTRMLHLARSGNPTLRAYQVCRTAILPSRAAKLLTDTSTTNCQATLDRIAPNIDPGLDSFQRASLLESTLYMGAQLLRDIDNFSMSESIEVRAPFLDHKLASFIWNLPTTSKRYNKTLKPLLIDAVRGGLPEVVPVHRKRGFTFPMQEWVKAGMEIDFRDIVLDSSNADFWNLEEVEKVWHDYQRGRVHWQLPWTFYVFANWKQAQHC